VSDQNRESGPRVSATATTTRAGAITKGHDRHGMTAFAGHMAHESQAHHAGHGDYGDHGDHVAMFRRLF
jgi:hypothetical protein